MGRPKIDFGKKLCKQCGEMYSRRSGQSGVSFLNSQFCGTECQTNSRRVTYKKTCINCGKPFETTGFLTNGNVTCSDECRFERAGVARTKKREILDSTEPMRVCELCGMPFAYDREIHHTRKRYRRTKTCGSECRGAIGHPSTKAFIESGGNTKPPPKVLEIIGRKADEMTGDAQLIIAALRLRIEELELTIQEHERARGLPVTPTTPPWLKGIT